METKKLKAILIRIYMPPMSESMSIIVKEFRTITSKSKFISIDISIKTMSSSSYDLTGYLSSLNIDSFEYFVKSSKSMAKSYNSICVFEIWNGIVYWT